MHPWPQRSPLLFISTEASSPLPPFPLPCNIISVVTCFTKVLNWWVSVRGSSRAGMEQHLAQSISILCLEQNFEWRDPESFLERSQHWAKRSKIMSNQNCQCSSSGCYSSQDQVLSLQYGPQWHRNRPTSYSRWHFCPEWLLGCSGRINTELLHLLI